VRGGFSGPPPETGACRVPDAEGVRKSPKNKPAVPKGRGLWGFDDLAVRGSAVTTVKASLTDADWVRLKAY
jgi:hypothetical protein